ncbi:carboxymuconolactone decarboxylase family protein [Haladaptatus sp. NG-SE-30]
MSRENTISLVTPEKATGQVRKRYEYIIQQREDDLDDDLTLSKLWMTFGNDPNLLDVVWEHTDYMYNGGELSFKLKSMISLVVATVMECEGCRFFHESALKREGADADSIEDMKNLQIGEEKFSPSEYEILVFAEKAARDPYDVTDEEFERLREIGLDDGEILEVIDCIAFHVYTSYVQAIAGIVYPGISHDEWVSLPETDE